MSELADITAAPVAYKLGDKVYELSPLTIADWGKWCRAVQFKPWHDIKDDEHIPQDVKDETLKNCLRYEVAFASPEFLTGIESPAGMIEMVYLSLVKRHPQITRGEVGAWSTAHVSNMATLANYLSNVIDDDVKKNLTDYIQKLRAKNLVV